MEEEEESLLSKKSLQLSLSPPRCPPFGTIHRSVLGGAYPLEDPYADHHHESIAHSNYNQHSGLRERMMHFIYQTSLQKASMPNPHLALGPDGADQITRLLANILPLSWQHHLRDSGGFRSICDNLVTLSIPGAAVTNPGAALRFLRLSRQVKTLSYGDHASQFIDVFCPVSRKQGTETNENDWTGMLFFVHGGAWGSGKPWFYRLVAQPFLDLNMAVAIVGYRVYPDAHIGLQVQDLEKAYHTLARKYPRICGPAREKRSIGFCVMGHSSGAHAALLMLVEQAKRSIIQIEQAEARRHRHRTGDEVQSTGGSGDAFSASVVFDSFVGISGPYDIGQHFDYEAARGVEEISPMKAANGNTRDHFRLNSPALRTMNFLATIEEAISARTCLSLHFPRMLMVHGIEDDTVPFTATGEAARIFRSCGIEDIHEHYLPLTGHQDAVVHLMLGGRVQDAIVNWLKKFKHTAHQSTSHSLYSKL